MNRLTSLPPAKQRWLVVLTFTLGLATLVLGGGGLIDDPRFAEALCEGGAFAEGAVVGHGGAPHTEPAD